MERGQYAEETAQKIDVEIKRIVTEAHDKARLILTGHRSQLEAVTRRLLEVEVMEGDELRRLLGLPPTPPTKGAPPPEVPPPGPIG
jgi:cell division protease FtsH